MKKNGLLLICILLCAFTFNFANGQTIIAKINFTTSSFIESDWANYYETSVGSYIDLGGGMTLTNISASNMTAGSYGLTGTIFPDNVSIGYHYIQTGDNSDKTYQVSGLSATKTYNFEFFACRQGTGDDRTTHYTIGGSSVSLNADNNYSHSVIINDVAPDASGNITFIIRKDASASYGYINGIKIYENGTSVPVTGVEVEPFSSEISIGGTEQLTATVLPTNASNKAVTWSSSNSSIASVNTSGLVTGVAAGSATITVTTSEGEFTDFCNITVVSSTIPVTGVALDSSIFETPINGSTQLTATVIPSNATNQNVTWSSSNTSVAVVNSSGRVLGVGEGSATITVTTQDGGFTDNCFVIVSGMISTYWQLGIGGIYYDGKVGVGTNSPDYELEVVGDINVTGNILQDGQAFGISSSDLISTNRNAIGLEHNMLFGADIKYDVTQTPTNVFNLNKLFDGRFEPSYTSSAPTSTSPFIVHIKGLPNAHTQRSAWIGWSTRYWPAKKFKIEAYEVYYNYGWVTIADYSVNEYQGGVFIMAMPQGSYTELKFTFYEGSGTNGEVGISELIYIHQENVVPYNGSKEIFYTNGKIGIGTAAPDAKLTVNGSIKAERIDVVSDVPASDHVFNTDYPLMSLKELDAFIQANKHLPEVPTAEEFKANGYSVGEMDDLLLRKIEELTLYIIELEKEMEELKAKINE